MMVPVICHADGQRFKVAKVTEALRCITCGSDDIDLDDDALSPQAQAKLGRARKVSMEGDLPMGLVDNYQPEMGLLKDRTVESQKVRCSTCFYEGKIATNSPLPPCDNCGANTLTVAGATARRKIAADITNEMVVTIEAPTLSQAGLIAKRENPDWYVGQISRNHSQNSTWDVRLFQLDAPMVRVVDIDTRLQEARASKTAYTADQWRELTLTFHELTGEHLSSSSLVEQAGRSVLDNTGDVVKAALVAASQAPLYRNDLSHHDGMLAHDRALQKMNKGASKTAESKVAEIADGILSTNPGMKRETALRVARETVRRYPKVAGRIKQAASADLIEQADAAYDRQDQAWFNALPIDDLVSLWASVSGPNLFNAAGAWDDEVFDALADRGWFEEHGINAPGGPTDIWSTSRRRGAARKTATDEAKADGKAAYEAGNPRVAPYPPPDADVGSPEAAAWTERMKAWYAGWDAANLVDASHESRRKTADLNPADVGVQVGDFFYSSWGYDQTNIDFYKVVGLTGASVRLQAVQARTVRSQPPTDYVVPSDTPIDLHYRTSEPFLARLISGGRSEPSVSSPKHIYGGGYAWKWDGQPVGRTSSGWGH